MCEIPLRQLPLEYRALLDKFYRAHRSHMRVPAGAQCWVAGHTDIVAGLCLTRIAEGHWLTGLLVAPGHRNEGLARRLVSQAVSVSGGPLWLFCEPNLTAFYQRQGFSEPAALPEVLASRLHRYNRTKTLLALCHDTRKTCPQTF
ncbi:GNAT family N-acetyltransferase [Stutzerimonas stutzeri]|uniref:GNAT family N-acetyltransferase n=1 Tax=Stutzerimonas stutzeri TaxID=316 RepID=UPI0018EF30D6|nr:GNAT family N-acetyltransferase [Stutzerimonas stutzeri]